MLAITPTAISVRSIRLGPVTFPFHDALAAGGVHELAFDSFGYRVQDVRVGDEVWLGIQTEHEQKFCAEISIRKRSGGRVPESHATKQTNPTYATERNAENDFLDFGIPIPKGKTRPSSTDEQRQRMIEHAMKHRQILEESERERQNRKQ